MPRCQMFVVCLLLMPLCSLWAEDRQASDGNDGKQVFVTAHSFHAFVGQRLAPIVKAAGIEGHKLAGTQVIGGSRVSQHWDLPEEKNKAKAALVTGEIDVLTMSPIWHFPDRGIDNFVELGLKHNPKLRVLVQASWMPWDDWEPARRVKTNDERDRRSLEVTRAANAKFKDMLEEQVRGLNEKHERQAVFIVPVGDAVLKLRGLIEKVEAPGIHKQSDLFTDPIGHVKGPVQCLTAYCFFAAIYRRSPEGLDVSDPVLDGAHPELRPLLQKIAWEVVTAYPPAGLKATPAAN